MNSYSIGIVRKSMKWKNKNRMWITTGFDTISDMTNNKRVTALWPRDIVSLSIITIIIIYYYYYCVCAFVNDRFENYTLTRVICLCNTTVILVVANYI